MSVGFGVVRAQRIWVALVWNSPEHRKWDDGWWFKNKFSKTIQGSVTISESLWILSIMTTRDTEKDREECVCWLLEAAESLFKPMQWPRINPCLRLVWIDRHYIWGECIWSSSMSGSQALGQVNTVRLRWGRRENKIKKNAGCSVSVCVVQSLTHVILKTF